MKAAAVCLFVIVMAVCPSVWAKQSQDILILINKEMSAARTPEIKARYLVYRARWFSNQGQFQSALIDFNSAIETDDRAWIRMERGKLLLRQGLYKEALDDAQAAKDYNYAVFQPDADNVIKIASEKLAFIEEMERIEAEANRKIVNPPTFIIDAEGNITMYQQELEE